VFNVAGDGQHEAIRAVVRLLVPQALFPGQGRHAVFRSSDQLPQRVPGEHLLLHQLESI